LRPVESRAFVRRIKFAVVANVAVCSASCTAAAASTKPAPAMFLSPKGNDVCCNICLTRANVRLGFACSMSAATPATLGAAAEVPKKGANDVSGGGGSTVVAMLSMPETASGL